MPKQAIAKAIATLSLSAIAPNAMANSFPAPTGENLITREQISTIAQEAFYLQKQVSINRMNLRIIEEESSRATRLAQSKSPINKVDLDNYINSQQRNKKSAITTAVSLSKDTLRLTSLYNQLKSIDSNSAYVKSLLGDLAPNNSPLPR